MKPKKKTAKSDDSGDEPLVKPKSKAAKTAGPVIIAKSRLRPSMGSIARKQQRVKKQEAEDNAPLAAPTASKSKRAEDSDDEPLVKPKKKAKPALPVVVAKSRLRPSMGSIARRQQRVKEKTNKMPKTRRQYPL